MSNGLHNSTTRNEAPESAFPKLLLLWKSVEPLSRNRDPNMTQIEHHTCMRFAADGKLMMTSFLVEL